MEDWVVCIIRGHKQGQSLNSYTKPCAAEQQQVADFLIGVTHAENQATSNVPMKPTTGQRTFPLILAPNFVCNYLSIANRGGESSRKRKFNLSTKAAKRSKLARQAGESASEGSYRSSLSFESQKSV